LIKLAKSPLLSKPLSFPEVTSFDSDVLAELFLLNEV
jgi:hypothetical protein